MLFVWLLALLHASKQIERAFCTHTHTSVHSHMLVFGSSPIRALIVYGSLDLGVCLRICVMTWVGNNLVAVWAVAIVHFVMGESARRVNGWGREIVLYAAECGLGCKVACESIL